MAKIKTKTKICRTYKGSDLIDARYSAGYIQADFAKRCYLSVSRYRPFEDGDFIIIPTGYKPIDQADFDIMQEALR